MRIQCLQNESKGGPDIRARRPKHIIDLKSRGGVPSATLLSSSRYIENRGLGGGVLSDLVDGANGDL